MVVVLYVCLSGYYHSSSYIPCILLKLGTHALGSLWHFEAYHMTFSKNVSLKHFGDIC